MIPFFVFYFWHWPTNEYIYFSKSDGSDTPVVILDDGWSPNITTYMKDGERTWSDVTEEIECMTNVATRDEALALLEKINAFVHRAARDIEERQEYTSLFYAQSQFSTALENAFTLVLSPPDDNNVITLSTDIQTAPPGQIRFKLRFKRIGEWIDAITYTQQQFYLDAQTNNYRGVWVGSTSLTAPVQIPTPITLRLKPVSTNNGTCTFETLFLCVNTLQQYVVKNLIIPPYMNATAITYPSSMLAQDNTGYLIQSDAIYSYYIPGLFSNVFIPRGTYAIFVSWRSVQPNVAHALKLRFRTRDETNYTLLFAKDTHPKITFLDTITLRVDSSSVYLLHKIGHSTGFELEKLVFVRLKPTSSIIQVQGLLKTFFIEPPELLVINNDTVETKNYVVIAQANTPNVLRRTLFTYDSLNIVADTQNISTVAIGHSPEVFSLRTYNGSTYAHVNSFDTTVRYRPIRTTLK